MATSDEQWLKEDGYLNVDTESVRIVYHPFLNVILVFTQLGEVKVLDVNSGVILQSYQISSNHPPRCRYLPDQDKILFWNDSNISMRGDYNGVLLLDTILQAPIAQADDSIRIEFLLSEAVLFLQCLQNLEQHGLENTADVTNELTLRIGEAQQHAKRGIKAQKWETICLELPHSSLRMVAGGMVMQLKRLDRHIPALAIASAINERLTDLLEGARVTEPTTLNRFHMFSEATRRQTFEGWPHMDYKWVLPDQMAQAGFYHYPGDNGNDDRAMCFTCNVCLVCWEKTDEPWSEHERHSPECPFVKGEFTQNVPLSVTYATSPAVSTGGFSIISSGDRGIVFCTGNASCDVTVWNTERQLTKVHDFEVKLHPDILTTTSISPTALIDGMELTALSTYFVKPLGSIPKPKVATLSLKPKMLGTKIICGVRVHCMPPDTDQLETILLLIVYNIEDPIQSSDEHTPSTGGNNKQANNSFPNSPSAIPIPPAKKSSLSTIDEKYEDNFLKFLSDNPDSQLLESIDKLICMDTLKKTESQLSQQFGAKLDDTLSKLIEASSSAAPSLMGGSSVEKLVTHEFAMQPPPPPAKLMPTNLAACTGGDSGSLKGPTSALFTNPNISSGSSGTTSTTQLLSAKSSVTDSSNVPSVASTATSAASSNCDISCTSLQYIELPNRDSHRHYCIEYVIPSSDNKHLLVVLKIKEEINIEESVIETNQEKETIPEETNKELIADEPKTILYLYFLNEEGLIRSEEPIERILSDGEAPIEIIMLPRCDSSGRCFGGPETEYGIFVMTCVDGKLRVFSLKTLGIISEASVKDDRFVSATYCKSLERLCGCTAKGCLHFYSFYDLDADSSDERDDDVSNIMGSNNIKLECNDQVQYDLQAAGTSVSSSVVNMLKYEATPSTSSSPAQLSTSAANSGNVRISPADNHPSGDVLLAYKNDLSMNTLRVLYSLTLFNDMLTPYSAEVPGCWSELEQAQKQRRHPQHLRPGDDTHLTKTWRLHNDAFTWDDHLIELNLPKCTSLGHIDFKFSLYQPCTSSPAIQVTLLKQKSIGLCSRRKTQSINRVDESINFNIGSTDGKNLIENPVLSEEYLQARNAEILVGPIELAACMDLSEQAGSVTLTSPKLLKSKGRNYLLHIKTMTDLSKDGQAKTRVPVRKKGITSILLTSFANISQQNHVTATNHATTAAAGNTGKDGISFLSDSAGPNKTRKNDFYIGCDWLNEISITVRSTRQVYKIENERAQRLAMLDSNLLLDNLLKLLYSKEESFQLQQNVVFDILIWVVSIRMVRYRYPKNPFAKKVLPTEIKDVASSDVNVQQSECIQIIEQHLEDIIRNCVVLGNRSIAHKCVKLISLALDGAQNIIDKDVCNSFEKSLKQAIITCLPEIINSNHAGALRWFTLLISGASTSDSHGPISEKCVFLLTEVANEMRKRSNPYVALLRTRFGLYGSPFEAEIFDSQPLTAKNNNITYTCSITKTTGTGANNQSIDLRSVCIADGSELKFLPLQLRRRGIGNHFKGLLEVEPLHYVCSSTSDATRLENVDASNIQATNIIDDFLMENSSQNNIETVQNHVKMEDKENLDDDMMNNVKNILVDKIFYSALKKHKMKDDFNEAKKTAEEIDSQNESFNEIESWGPSNEPRIVFVAENGNESSIIYDKSQASIALNNKIQEFFEDSNTDESANGLPWHKLLSTPPKQMIVVERMHSGAMRYITLDFGSPIMLTDLIIPACSDLASLFIDIWCFEEEADSIRLVVSQDIGARTLVLSDLQPPPICRYLKITITGRYGMSATRCRIPMGSFYGHIVILEREGYGDPVMKYLKNRKINLPAQVKILKALYEDVHCRYCLSSSKLMDMLQPLVNSESSNIAHMQAFLNRIKENNGDSTGSNSANSSFPDNQKVYVIYEECMAFQHQLNVIKRVIDRIKGPLPLAEQPRQLKLGSDLSSLYTDKLRVLSECLIETLLHLITTYGIQNVTNIYPYFDLDTCNLLFDTLVINGDTHIQLATCSMLVRMCCFQSWWGDFLADKFLKLYSSQNSRIFPQDRVFFLLTYLGRKSISMGSCRSIVIDAILKSLATLLAPLSTNTSNGLNIWCNTDLNLLGWILLFLSVCLDDGMSESKKDQSNMRWDFMSGETDMVKARLSMSNGGLRTLTRTFKKRFLQSKHSSSGISSGNSNTMGEKMYTIHTDTLQGAASKLEMALKQHENQLKKLQNSVKQSFGDYFNDITKGKSIRVSSGTEGMPRNTFCNNASKENSSDGSTNDNETAFDKGLKSLKIGNIIVVIRGLIGLILSMDFTCNMDLFLITCKIIARLVLACKPVVQLSKIITTNQLLQLVRIAVWENQQQPWAVHAITCLLQDVLEADKSYKDDENDSGNSSGDEVSASASEPSSSTRPPVLETAFKPVTHNIQVTKDVSYADAVKNQLPSLMECDDADMEDILILDDMLEREKRVFKKDGNASVTTGRNGLSFLYKTISSAMDARLDIGLDTNVEITLRRLAMKATFNLIASLPQVTAGELLNASSNVELEGWPDTIVEAWSGVEYQQGIETNAMLTEVFDNILCDLHLVDSWLNLEKILQLWLTLNGETLEQVPGSNAPGLNAYSFPKIPFGDRAIHGLLNALATHPNIKLRAWCLGFQCLILACKPHFEADYMDANCTSSDNHFRRMGNLIVSDDNFEKMLLRFFSGVDQSLSTLDSNRYAGPTVCKLVLELFIWLELKCNVKDKLKEILLKVILHLVQFGGAISNQQGPIDAQSQLIKELLSFSYDKSDLGVAMSIIECVSHLVYNNIVNVEKLYCYRATETSSSNNMFGTRFGSLFATVLGSENARQCKTVTDNTLLIDLLKLASILVNTKNPRTGEDNATSHENASFNELNTSNESQTDEIKAEQQHIEQRPKTPCFADTVLQHTPTMTRLLSSLSHCSNSSFAMLVASSMYSSTMNESKNNTLSEPQTVADAVFQLLLYLSRTATQNILVVKPLFDYINNAANMRHAMPKLHLSEPFLWFILKVLETSSSVAMFTEMGGIRVLCENLVRSNRALINTQPSLVSMIMQRLSKSSNLQTSHSSSSKKNSISTPRNEDGLINFAPYCTISSENQTAQPADVLIQAPIASHRRARNPAWSYLFYPNESHVDLTITLPTAVLLKEVQLQPHVSTLGSCPSAVAIEITRDSNLGPIPITQPISTVGMTCIRLKFAQPEIATSVIIRLYRPRDATNIGLTQISVLGTTTFSDVNYGTYSGTNWSNGNLAAGGISKPTGDALNEYNNDDDKVAKTSLGWLRILAQCFSVVIYASDQLLSNRVIIAATEVPGFLEACCSLLNIAPSSPNFALQNLETVLLKLGLHSREFGLKLINILLKESIPQTFQLCNDSISDLLYHLCTTQNDFTRDRLEAVLTWIQRLFERYHQNHANKFVLHVTNPYSGFIKCLASILWQVYATDLIPDLPNMITKELFETLYDWNQELEHDEPLKKAIDAVLCSICCIRPEFFTMLLKRMGVLVPNLSTDLTASISDDRKDGECITDDIKQEESDAAEWYSHLVIEDISRLKLSKSQLSTISMACQSPLAVQQLIDSGLPNLLTSVILEFCHSALNCTSQTPRSKFVSGNMERDNRERIEENEELITGAAGCVETDESSSCMTDADKEHHKYSGHNSRALFCPMISIKKVTEILEFFTEICTEGHMRDWLGGFEGSIFWEPILLLLCNNKLSNNALEVTPQACLDLEECLIKFLSNVTACHPKNQEVLTVNLISVIRKSDSNVSSGASSTADTNTANVAGINNRINNGSKSCISGFTRRLVLQILLESEKIMIAVRSDLPLQIKEQNLYNVSYHPSKRSNAHFLCFYLSANSKCQEILDHCATVYNQIIPNLPTDNRASEVLAGSSSAAHIPGGNDNRKELWEMGLGMEFLSVAAGVTAKDKRLKEAKNQATTMKQKDIMSMFKLKIDDPKISTPDGIMLTHSAVPHGLITSDATISQILAMLKSVGVSLSTPCINLNLVESKNKTDIDLTCESSSSAHATPTLKAADFIPLASPLQIFSSRGGLSLLAHYLPTVYPETPKAQHQFNEKDKSPPGNEWVKVEQNEEIYEDLDDILTETSPKTQTISAVPQHSLAAFALFLKLPAYSEVLLRDKLRAQCLLRLILGVTGDGEGNEIYSLALSSSLPTLPFEVFRQLLDSSPLTTDDGVLLRRMVIEVGAVHLVLNCLSIFTHHNSRSSGSNSSSSENIQATASNKSATTATSGNNVDDSINSDDKSHMYWAKGTGFGTGSTQQSWNVEQALLRQKSEEEHVTVLLQVLSSYINPGDKVPSNLENEELSYRECSETLPELPPIFLDLLQQSCLIPALSSYLRNDSVLDITRHIPLYRAILQLLRAISLSNQLVSLLVNKNNEGRISIASLLSNMKACVDTYASRLKVNKKSNLKGQTQKITVSLDDGDDEGLALLIPDIQETSILVQSATNLENIIAEEEKKEHVQRPMAKSVEDKYLEIMKVLQFDTYEMIAETDNGYRFTISHHFETNVRMAGDRGHPGRVKRLAQETVTLSTSLPLSYSSSVFVRCDTDRLDIMKVLITGPSDTPYANGCFEFDVYFPPDYPNSPMMINLETTGRNTVRFNPNLYNDGKVCLSVLNTWHGRPEEKWNAHTSSFLQVLVSIQSLILVPEPYFNEPGFERSRGSPSGTHSSREYNSNIYQACVRYAMLEQLKNPCPCFKDVIHAHFWLKRNEICAQIEDWIAELSKPPQYERAGRTISFNAMVLRRQYRQLREELAKLVPPDGLEEIDYPFNAGITPTTPSNFPVGISSNASDSPPEKLMSEEKTNTGMGPEVNEEAIEIDVQYEADEIIVKADTEEYEEQEAGSSGNDKGTSIPDEAQDENPDLTPEEIVLSMV
ncbi:baculoviral IAP repeat-containing protein 6 isoform X2 [Sabethes cyaneus]|nr:baculoviral IAP repeat-containing protein 6 isoform X2 [Sabethes cyaneus]